ncbi:MAG: two-component sensor histidine kinase [Acidobacteria bacterium]|nr:MAG: two-component sensor histidine kinase [Acidobacteriota bacterium]
MKVRLRTKFLIALLLISIGLTGTSLLIVRQTVNTQIREQIIADLHSSILTFRNFQNERENALSHSAELLSNLPSLKALMTTEHAATIQDASLDFWKLGGSDLFVLADRSGKIVALHTSSPAFTIQIAQQSLDRSLQSGERSQWWFGAGHLYQVFLQPIYFGPANANSSLGVLAVGHEIDDRVAKEISQIAASQVAFWYGKSIAVSTLSSRQESELAQQVGSGLKHDPSDVQLGDERYLEASLELAPSAPLEVHLSVLKSYDEATHFLTGIYRFLMVVGLMAIFCEGLLVFLISRRFTRPLENLVAGVRALEKGDFAYPLEPHGGDEVAEVTAAFDRMRTNLRKTQQRLLDSERLATIGQMASSISHDMRHQLTAIVANSEFLSEHKLDSSQREEFYHEIRLAVSQMTDLIESLLEFSRTRESLSLVYGSVEEVVKRSIQAVRANPEFQGVSIAVACEEPSDCWYDARKLERAFYNLLLNACQAVPRASGRIEITIRLSEKALEVYVADNGPGIAEPIRDRLFEPFVSFGKENGTGLGLTIVQKIVEDHGGSVSIESTRPGYTLFKLTLPFSLNPRPTSAEGREATAGSLSTH